MFTPLFSIIVPVYNVEGYIEQCCDSILNQKNSDFELILVDDGSTDGSGDICDAYSNDNRVRVIHKINGGLSDARNFGLKYATGKYVLFVDSDDFFDDYFFLSQAQEILSENNCDILIFGYKKYYEESAKFKEFSFNIPEKVEKFEFEELVAKNLYVLSAWGKIIKNNILKENNLFFTKGVLSEDMDWCVRLAAVAQTYVVFNSTPYIYRQRNGSITKSPSEEKINDLERNLKKSIEVLDAVDNEKKKRALYMFVSQFFSMYLINLSLLKSKKQKQHYQFVNDFQYVLKFGIRRREKGLYLILNILGKRLMLIALKVVYKNVRKI